MRLLVAGYRDWALDMFNDLTYEVEGNHELGLVTTKRTLSDAVSGDKVWDAIALVGWSWIVPDSIIDKTYTVCIHPSALPKYAGGSPIQHQILAGLTETDVTLFKVTHEIDGGPIIDQTDLSLEGSILRIFDQLCHASVELLTDFMDHWPNIEETPQPVFRPKPLKRRKPDMSRLTPDAIRDMTARQLYDFIRCLADPYPNAYIEDESGRLLLKDVEFEPREDENK